MNDTEILALFLARREQAVSEAWEAYGRLCQHVAENMLGNPQDAEECVSDAMLAAWNQIPPDRPAHLSAYLCKITKNQALKRLEYDGAQKRDSHRRLSLDELGDVVSGRSDVGEALDAKELGAAISRFLRKQSQRDRVLFIRRYWYCDDLAALARQSGLSEQKLSGILFRLRRKLRADLKKEGYSL